MLLVDGDNFCCLKFANNLDKGFYADRPYAQPDLLFARRMEGGSTMLQLSFCCEGPALGSVIHQGVHEDTGGVLDVCHAKEKPHLHLDEILELRAAWKPGSVTY